MRYVLALLVLLTTPAKAESCFEVKSAVKALIAQNYLPRVDGEIQGFPMMIFVNPKGDWVSIVLVDENTACEVAHGRAWNEVKWRKA